MKCIGCSVTVESDGHGELVHAVPVNQTVAYVYGCEPKTKSKTEYPVAH